MIMLSGFLCFKALWNVRFTMPKTFVFQLQLSHNIERRISSCEVGENSKKYSMKSQNYKKNLNGFYDIKVEEISRVFYFFCFTLARFLSWCRVIKSRWIIACVTTTRERHIYWELHNAHIEKAKEKYILKILSWLNVTWWIYFFIFFFSFRFRADSFGTSSFTICLSHTTAKWINWIDVNMQKLYFLNLLFLS